MDPYGNAKSQGMTANKPSTLGDHLQGIKNEIGELIGRLSTIADRVSGSVPTPVGESAPTPMRNHMSDAHEARKMLSDLRDQVNRLDSAL